VFRASGNPKNRRRRDARRRDARRRDARRRDDGANDATTTARRRRRRDPTRAIERGGDESSAASSAIAGAVDGASGTRKSEPRPARRSRAMATSRRARARRGRRRKRREDVLDAGTGAEARRLTFGVSTAWSVRAKEGDSMRGRAKKLEFFSTWTYVNM